MLRGATVGLLMVCLGGCVPHGSELALVPNSFLQSSQPVMQAFKTPETPASHESAVRVAEIGQKLVAANPTARLRPFFTTIGADWDEIFHKGDREIVITEGLVKKCKNDAQIAALLANEMSKMAAEREALSGTQSLHGTYGPPPEVRIGTDAGGVFGPPDGTRLAEELKYARDRHSTRPTVSPDARPLARTYLGRADYPAAALTEVAPLLRSAEGNVRLEKQMTGEKTSPR